MRSYGTRRWQLEAAIFLLASALFGSTPAMAKEPRFFLSLGPGHVSYRPAKEISTPSGVVPGAGARVVPHASVILDSGMYIADNWSVAVSSGLPPTIRIRGTGTTAGLGELGKATYGSTILLLQRQIPIKGVGSAYIGAGPVYSIIFSTKGVSAEKLHLSDELGFALQAGSVFHLDRNYGVFVDVKKTFIRSRTEMVIGQVRYTSSSHPSPLTIAGGLSYRF